MHKTGVLVLCIATISCTNDYFYLTLSCTNDMIRVQPEKPATNHTKDKREVHIMKIAANIATEVRLTAAGWEYDHTATCSIYSPAGSVTAMQTRNGYEYCRVHCGRCVGRHCYQITYVYRRALTA